jgi:hypothetical protein
MRPWKRICSNLLLPPPIGLAYVVVFVWAYEARKGLRGPLHIPVRQDMLEGAVIVLMAYVIAIVPSAVFTAALEFLYRRRGLSTQSGKALVYSAIGGALSGTAICAAFQMDGSGAATLAIYPMAGALTGLTVAVIIRWDLVKAPIAIGCVSILCIGTGIWALTAAPSPGSDSLALSETLVAHPDDTGAWAKLDALARSPDYWSRFYGLGAMGQVGFQQPRLRSAVTSILVNALGGSMDQATTRETILSINRLGTHAVEAAWKPLIGIVEAALAPGADYHGERDVDWFAVDALGKVRDPAKTDPTIALLSRALARPPTPGVQAEAPAIRYDALDSLMEIAGAGPPELRSQILRVIEDRKATADPYFAKKLGRAMARLGGNPIP